MAPALRMTRSIKEKLPFFFVNFSDLGTNKTQLVRTTAVAEGDNGKRAAFFLLRGRARGDWVSVQDRVSLAGGARAMLNLTAL